MYYIGIDVGSSLIKGVLYDSRTRALAHAKASPSLQQQDGKLVYDPKAFWQVFEKVLMPLVRCSASGSHVALGLSVQRSSLIVVRRHSKKPLTPIISWQDLRGQALIDNKKKHWEHIERLSGLRPNGHYGASKLEWFFRTHKPGESAKNSFADSVYCLPLGSWLVWKLVGGTPQVDPTLAQRTLLMDLGTLAWSQQLCTLFGVPLSSLPKIKNTIDDYGCFKCLGRTVQIKILVGDQQAAAIGAWQGFRPVLNSALVSLGTGGFVLAPLEPGTPKKFGGCLSSVLCGNRHQTHYVAEGTLNHVGTLFKRWERLTGWDVKKILQSKISTAHPGSFMPAGFSLGSPLWQANPAGEWHISSYGRSSVSSTRYPVPIRLQTIQAMTTAVVGLIQKNLQAMKRYPDVLLLCGGWSRFPMIQQAIAQVTGCRVKLSAEKDLGLRGILWLLTQGERQGARH